MVCAMLQRTQILLERWQYEALKARAQVEGRSVSDLVREIVGSALRGTDGDGSWLEGLEAIGRDAEARGRDHDRFLYGQDAEHTAD
jgi:hypothetical protein